VTLTKSSKFNPVPSCADWNELAWIADIGYKNMMLCDELCLKEELLSRAVNAFQAFKENYEGGTQKVPIRILPRSTKPVRVVLPPQPVKAPTSVFGKGWAWIGGRARSV
jgi:hypothetical protein